MRRIIAVHDVVLDAYELSFAYDAIMVSAIKTFIPASHRSWNPIAKQWTVDGTMWDNLKEIFRANGYLVKTETKIASSAGWTSPEDFFFNDPAPAANVETAATIAAKLGEFIGVTILSQDITELKKYYRQTARQLHPDLGGDAGKMSELNRLWTLYTGRIN